MAESGQGTVVVTHHGQGVGHGNTFTPQGINQAECHSVIGC